MGWFGKKTPDLPPWTPSKEFVVEPLEGYLDPHTESVLLEVKEMISPPDRGDIFIAGGFAAHVAGITKTSGDVDLFCLDRDVFQRVSKTLPGEVVKSRGSGTVICFKHNCITYDLIDTYDRANAPSFDGLIHSFDINWCMAAIDFEQDRIAFLREAVSGTPLLNSKRGEMPTEETIKRLEKYKERLVAEVDLPAYNTLVAELQAKAKREIKLANKASRWY
jgi:hypothetical protein